MPDTDTSIAGATPASRQVALAVLGAVLGHGQPLEDTLAANPRYTALDVRDRAFVRLLLGTLLRRLGEIDAALATCLVHPLPPAATVVMDILRLGAAQILFVGTPAHAAVDTSVRLVEQVRAGRFKGLVNAVLRRLARERDGRRLDDAAAARVNTPAWLWESWIAAYGPAQAQAIAVQHLHEPPLDFSLRDPSAAAQWAERLGADILPNGTLRRPAGGRIEELPGYAEGAWWVQDAAASLPVRLLGDMAGRDVIDLCAAPGGKTLQLAAAGARVTAVDISARRMQRLADNLARCRLDAALVTADAVGWQPARPADAVLLDAPCSATGTLRRHPDIARTRTAADVARLAQLQDRLLAAAARMLRPGGVLVYAVCSLQPDEGPVRVAGALQAGLGLQRSAVHPQELPGLEQAVSDSGAVRTLPCFWPDRRGMDSFYMARLRVA